MPGENENAESAEGAASGENENENEQEQEQQQEQQQQEKEPKFNKAQMQQISSVMGNMIKKVMDESVVPMLQQKPDMLQAPNDDPALANFNEKLQGKIFAGDVVGALQDFMNVSEKATKSLSDKQQTALNKQISGYEEKPFYKDIFPKFEKLARQLVSKKGYPVDAAAELAYQTATTEHLVNVQSGNAGNLNMTTGGKRTFTPNEGKLPEQFEAAYQRDKEKGLFKDRKDFISSLSPQVRKQYEI